MKIAALLVAVLCSGCIIKSNRRHNRQPNTMASERRDDRRDARTEAMTGWTKLGERWVQGAVDRDVIPVGVADGRFRQITLKAEHSALELFDVVVTFGNGETFSPNTRMVFGQGAWSRVIDLPGEARAIAKVEFRYGNLPGGGKAQLELWAK